MSNTDATKSRLGDDYHLLIALQYCMSGTEGNTVHIEKYGDIAYNNTSIESKHHFDSKHTTGTNHIDIWKTIFNWTNDQNTFEKYNKLELISTSKISKDNEFLEWNNLSSIKKVELLDKLVKRSNIPDSIEKYSQGVKLFLDSKELRYKRKFLSKIKLSFNSENIDKKLVSLKKSSFLKSIPEPNRYAYLNLLHGFILGKRIEDPTHWKVDIDDFNNFHLLNVRNYVSDVIPIPDTFSTASVDPSAYIDYEFIKELKKIGLDRRIPDAANDYFRAQKTTLMLVNDNPLCSNNLQKYQEVDVYDRLDLLKEEVGLEIDNIGSQKCSKKCYLKAMQLDLLRIKGYEPNKLFYQKGTIHSVVNDTRNNFSWLYNN